jgi:ribose transport system permease protein
MTPARSATAADLANGRQANVVQSLRTFVTSPEGLLLAALLVVGAFFTFATDAFFSTRNLVNLATQVSMLGITAVGMTLLLTTGEVDLSVGSQQALIGVLAMQTLNSTESLLIGVLAALAVGALIGLVNGLLTITLGISSLIVTLAMFSIVRGGAYMSTTAAVQNHHNLPEFAFIGKGIVGGLPFPLIIAIVVFIAAGIFVTKTTLGRYLAVVGGNRDAARLVGIPVASVKVGMFVLVGILSATSAFILISRLNSGQNNAGFGFELIVIAAVLLGGTSLFGGRGSLLGTLFAVLLLGTLANGTVLMGIRSTWHLAINGGVILIALFLDSRRRAALGEFR